MRLLAINLTANYRGFFSPQKAVLEKVKRKYSDVFESARQKKELMDPHPLLTSWNGSKKIKSDNLLAKINTKSKRRNFFFGMTALLLLLQLYTIDDLSAFYFGFCLLLLTHLARLRRRINNE